MKRLKWLMLLLGLSACYNTRQQEPLFRLMPAEETGIDFANIVEHTAEFNMYTYRNFYNGGGVGIGDINNDGLADLFFCGNLKDNKLYLNKGNFKFEDITATAGVASENVWSTGVSFADVNGDGWLDIYVCKSGKPGGEKRYNELFINNGDLTFTEMAKKYDVADEGFSSHAAFFDYDKDGDLDFYLLNNSFRPVGGYDIRPGLREVRDTLGGNKLYRNDGERFTDVSEAAGIYGSSIGFGLGVSIGDVNRDGWQDIFVSNDFFERDYLYINRKDGTFKEDLVNQMGEISMGSMGADISDINNDGYPEVFVTEMLPASEERYKTKMTFENWDKYQLNVKNGYHHQFTRNVLQLNNGNNTFSEIGRLANVHATDWSWSALITDLDNDGAKDIYVSNGIFKDLLDQDYINFHSNDPEILALIRARKEEGILQLIDKIPSEKVTNFAFRNDRDLTFTDCTEEWGLAIPSFSNGSAYGDLDNDGDLDLVVNNCNMPAFVFQNQAAQLDEANHYLQFDLVGEGKNTHALGTQITIFQEGLELYQELAPMRGFLSCVDDKLHFGLGEAETVERIEVLWPDGRETVLENVPANQILTLRQSEASAIEETENFDQSPKRLQEITARLGLDFRHRENDFVDFDRDKMLFHMVSAEGPKLCKADVNQDGREDFFVGGANGQVGVLFLQQANGQFRPKDQPAFEQDRMYEDTDAVFFDADNDGDQDLYVASGSNEFSMRSTFLFNRLYLNDGRGNFKKSPQKLPAGKPESVSCVRPADFDQDGDMDLAVGVRLKPSVYGVPVNGFILENDGKGGFQDRTSTLAPDLEQIGMITDLQWVDYDQDQDLDLILVGDWMPVTVFENQDGQFENVTEQVGLGKSNGFWNCLEIADLDSDGDQDLVIGNHGQNSRFKASEDKPIEMWVNDFDGNRTAEQIISVYNGEVSYPLVLRHDLVAQMPKLKKKYLFYEQYKAQTVEDIFTDKQLRTSAKSIVYHTSSSVAINNGDGTFTLKALPKRAQFTPVFAVLVEDFNDDQNLDVLLGGNFYRSKPEVGIYDAGKGLLLEGNGEGGFQALLPSASGILIEGEVRDMLSIQVGGEKIVIVARNNNGLLAYKIL